MCGIVGVMTSEPIRYGSDVGKFFKQALFADTLRGVDSTGVACINTIKEEKPEIFKKAMAAPDFLQLKQTEAILHDNNDWNVMIGHNRAATKGGITHSTAHPFQIGDTTLVHNGTVYNHRQLTGGTSFNVDSEAITNAIDLDGVGDVVKKLNGAFTLVWHDAETNTVNFIRNKERPMWVGITKDTKTVLFASEGNMLQWLAIRNKFDLGEVYQLDEGIHYQYKVGDGDNWATDPVETALPFYSPPATTYPNGGYKSGKKTQGGGTPTQRGGTTTKGSTNKHTFRDKMLENLGVGSAEGVVVCPKRWVPFRSSNMNHTGILHCKVRGNITHHEVILYDISEEQSKILLKQFLVGDIVSADTRGGTNTLVMSKHTMTGFTTIKELHTFLDGTLVGKGGKKKKEKKDEAEDKKVKSSRDDELVRGPGESVVARSLFKELVAKGCDVCGSSIADHESDETEWTRESNPICAYCAMQYGNHITH